MNALEILLKKAEADENYELCIEIRDRIKRGETAPEAPSRTTGGLYCQMVGNSPDAVINNVYNAAIASLDEQRRSFEERMKALRDEAFERGKKESTEPNWKELDELRERYEGEVNTMLEKRLKKVAPRASSRTVMQSLIATVDKRRMTVEYTYKGKIILRVLFGEFGVAFRLK